MEFTKEERRLYARRNESDEDNSAWRESLKKRTAPAVVVSNRPGQLTREDYEAGYHEAWDAHLHARRQWHSDRNLTYTSQEETNDLTRFMQIHKNDAYAKVPCSVCTEEIAERILGGHEQLQMRLISKV